MNKKRIAFLFDHKYPEIWRDGLWAALQLLSDDYDILYINLAFNLPNLEDIDFILGWGGFDSPVDKFLRTVTHLPKGLCIGGNAFPPSNTDTYDVLFYETEWYKPNIKDHRNIVHAFGVNTDIYKPMDLPKVFDYITVGSFSLWKRQFLLTRKAGVKIAVGEIQKDNMDESGNIVGALLPRGVGVMDMVAPEKLAVLINLSKTCYIPATTIGGGERAVLESRACGIDVEIEPDNPKLLEFLDSPIYDHKYYAKQLKKGIESCLN